MTTPPWRYAFASVIGTSHTKSSLPCQDASDCRLLMSASGEAVLVSVVSDGAGSAERSQVGSQLACALFMDEIAALLEAKEAVAAVTKEFCQQWLIRFQREIAVRAEEEEKTGRDFACTLLAAVIGSDSAAFIQIGDGAIVVQSAATPTGDYDWIFWPERGEYENQTYFATDVSAGDHLQYTFASRINEVALFSDGLQRLALHMESQSAHTPFFRPMFAPLYKADEGHSLSLSVALGHFLGSKRVQDQTDDDASLILATRIPAPPPAAE